MDELQTIQSEQDYEKALRDLTILWGAKPGTADGERLNNLVDRIVAYEDEHFPMGTPDEESIRQFLADQNGSQAGAQTSNDSYRFVLIKDRNGQYMFQLIAPNGEIMFHSSPFTSREKAINTIRTLQSLQDYQTTIDEAA
ncbi:DUF1508 domain-containing protein [Rhizobium sp. SL86]|uniref:DUF1508 domain-containing protein n=1 Tax=Rhizobium sp. SL86 TaxID=2995148 RepID=UPI002273C77C|nr:DUF1508 domain-containing protein [Rhizobium sp. SL86]MCY1668096.1 DUF1508 domain-containing protein [Rhizobium sp. SL86]